MQKLTKFYFRKDHDIFYFSFESTHSVEYGLMIGDNYNSIIELNADQFRLLNVDVIVTLIKTIYEMQLEENPVLPITIFEVQQYEDYKICIVEVKFETLRLSKEFEVPKWFGNEIIDNHFDLNLALSTIVQSDILSEVATIIENSEPLTWEQKMGIAENERNQRRGGTLDELWERKKAARAKKI
jgi:hypothetical protein